MQVYGYKPRKKIVHAEMILMKRAGTQIFLTFLVTEHRNVEVFRPSVIR